MFDFLKPSLVHKHYIHRSVLLSDIPGDTSLRLNALDWTLRHETQTICQKFDERPLLGQEDKTELFHKKAVLHAPLCWLEETIFQLVWLGETLFQPVWLGETYLNYLAGRNRLRLGWEKAQCAQLAWTVGAELAQADALTSVHCVVCIRCDRRKQHNEPIKTRCKYMSQPASHDWL